jgi:hypothetical protein
VVVGDGDGDGTGGDGDGSRDRVIRRSSGNVDMETGASEETEVVPTRRWTGVAWWWLSGVGVEENGRDGDGDSAGGDGGDCKCERVPGACLSEPPEVAGTDGRAAVNGGRPVNDGGGERRAAGE